MNKKGLTVFELLVAVGLFAFLATALLPGMRSFFRRLEVHNALRTLSAGLNTARYLAIRDNRPVRAELVPGRLQLSVDDGGDWRVIRSFQLDETLAIRANGRPVFSPLGNVSPLCTVTVESRQRTCRVVISMYGRIRVYDDS
jgi:type II secretory pathway pseudopilin PulG